MKAMFKRLLQLTFLLHLLLFVNCSSNSNKQETDSQFITETQTNNITDTTLSRANRIEQLYTEVNILIGREEYEAAVGKLLDIIKLDSLDARYSFDTGFCLTNLNRDSAAVIFYKESLNKGYDKFEVYRVLGITYSLKFNDYEKGLYYFRLCKELKPNDDEINEFIRVSEKRYRDNT